MIDTKIFTTKRKDGKFAVELSICMQMNLDIYVEPIPGKASTYENEHKRYFFTLEKLEDLVEIAGDKIQSFTDSVYRCIGYEAAGLTYKEMTIAMGGSPSTFVTDNKYSAAEDLVFLYGQLQIMHDFIFEVQGCWRKETGNAGSE